MAQKTAGDLRRNSVFEALPDGILITDLEGRITFVNHQLGDLAGYEPEDLVGEPVEMLVPVGLRGQHQGHRDDYVKAGLPTRPMGANLRIRLLSRTGQEIPVDISLRRIDIEGRVHVLGAVRDATERNRWLARLALVDERERIGRELHDGVIQSLFAVGMNLEASASIAGPGELQERLQRSVAELDGAIRDLRSFIYGLRPGILADRRLSQAISDLAADVEAKAGIVMALDVDEGAASQLAEEAGDVIQLVREALSNVARHSGAATCRVSLRREAEEAVLIVEDDGRGFNPALAHSGQGLGNLRGRAEHLGGTFRVGPAPDRGTRVEIRLPIGER